MNVDFGILCTFTIQLGFVMAVYHAWRGIKAEISALESLRESMRALGTRIDAQNGKIDALAEKVVAVEENPKATKARMDELDTFVRSLDRSINALDAKQVSLAARLSAFGKARKVKDDDGEMAPASEEEGMQIPMGQMPPGAIRLNEPPPQAAVPPGFGVVGRSKRHG